jgi:dihydroorotate dehydrogenase (NAD+) catalytic subunit
MDPRLSTTFFGKKAASPLVLASGIMGVSYSGMLKAVENGCGIITTKSMTLEPRKGHDGPVVAEFQGGFINSMGLSNPGIEEGLQEVTDFRKYSDAPLIVSVFGTTADEFTALIRYVNDSQADAVELNLSCPNVADEYGTPLASSAEKVGEIISAVKTISKLPVIAKLSPNSYNVPEIGKAAESAGADALTLVNTLGPGMLIDIEAQRPVILNKFGGVSGYALKPIAVKIVYQTSHMLSIPIIGTGGITNGSDAIEFRLAGASFFGVGTAVYYQGIEVFSKINDEIIAYLDRHNIESCYDIKPIA